MSLFQSVYLWLINLKISYSLGGYSPLIFLFACPLLIGPFMPLLEERTVPRRPTYALHEERDLYQIHFYIIVDFLIHTLRGERDVPFQPSNLLQVQFQLTRSVGSVTLHIVYVKSHHHNRADILLKITLKSDIFYIICIIFSANLHIKPISLHVRSQNQTALRIICFLCTYMLHSPLPIITQIIESKAILFFINNFHKSIF